jgi:hypothetical protein
LHYQWKILGRDAFVKCLRVLWRNVKLLNYNILDVSFCAEIEKLVLGVSVHADGFN